MILLMISGVISANAYDFAVDGIYYNKLSDTTCSVTYLTEDYSGYSGNVVIPKTVAYDGVEYTVTAIGDHAFGNSTGLTSISIPNSVTEIGFGSFSGCFRLTAVTIPDSVTVIGGFAFTNCAGLTSVVIPDSVTEIQYCAFGECDNLTSVTIGNSVTKIGIDAFLNCSRLASVIVGKSVTEIGDNAFRGCDGLVKCAYPSSISDPFYVMNCLSISYPEDAIIEDGIIWGANKSELYFVSLSFEGEFTFPDTVTRIGNHSFAYCAGLTSVNTGSVTSIGDYAFAWCAGLTSAAIGDSVTSISDYSFYCCYGLTSVTLGNSVTSIGESAFEECSSIEHIEIPGSVTSISDYAFYECTGLESVTCVWDEPLQVTDNYIFSSEIYESCPLYVPIGTKDKYANTATWCKFENIYEHNEGKVYEISSDNDANVSVDGSAICISSDSDVRVVSMNGATVYSGYGEARVNLASGIYIVLVGNIATKVIVR
jgi:hypothetical protein